MSISGIKTDIQTSLEKITGLTVYDVIPAKLNVWPVATIFPAFPIHYDDTLQNGLAHMNFEVTIIVIRQDIAEAQRKLDVYLDKTGTSSVKAVIEAINSTDNYQSIRVPQCSYYGPMEISGTVYLGARFDVLVYF